MKYKVIFAFGYDDDIASISQGNKADVLILDEHGDYYCPQFITAERLYNESVSAVPCYLEENLVIVPEITKSSILEYVKELYGWQFQRRWRPITKEELEKYFGTPDQWYFVEMDL